MAATIPFEPFAVRAMLWDDAQVELVPLCSGRLGSAFVLAADGPVRATVCKALAMADIDSLLFEDAESFLTRLRTGKPDIIVYDAALAQGSFSAFAAQIEAARITETLPTVVLAEGPSPSRSIPFLSGDSTLAEMFLTFRALLRRQRPSALKGQRRSGAFVLDERGFRLFKQDECAVITKTDLCVLGPFFDVRASVIDRTTLARLAFLPSDQKAGSRIIDTHISRLRRTVRDQLGVDPLRSIRSQGYALAM